MALVVDAAPFCRLWDVRLKLGGGLCLVALKVICSHSVLVLAVYFVASSFAVSAHLRARKFTVLSMPLKKAFMDRATLGMSFDRICLVCFSPSRRCWFPFSLLRRRVMCVASTTRSSLLAHAPHFPRHKKT